MNGRRLTFGVSLRLAESRRHRRGPTDPCTSWPNLLASPLRRQGSTVLGIFLSGFVSSPLGRQGSNGFRYFPERFCIVSPAQAGVQCIEFAETAPKNGKKIEVD